MHIIRFTDKNDRVNYGHKHIDDTAVLLDGHLYNGLKTTGEKTRVKKLLVPVKPAAILCIGPTTRVIRLLYLLCAWTH